MNFCEEDKKEGSDKRACCKKAFRKCNRLRSGEVINSIFEEGIKFVGRFQVLFCRKGGSTDSRLAVIAGSKIFPDAVQRNRIRRIIREVFRLNKHLLDGQWDIVLVSRTAMGKAGYREVENDFLELAEKAGLLKS